MEFSDMDCDSDLASEYESVNSQNYVHRVEDGRRFHGYVDAPYMLPNDEEEVGRLQDIHYCIRQLLRKNIVVPISRNPELIVDVGTGSGLWVIDVADQYPNARVIGTDISPIQPTDEIPPNSEFRMESLLEGLNFDDDSVDLLHSQWLALAVPANCWQFYLTEIYRVLKLGTGWIQMLEFDRYGVGGFYSQNNSLPENSAASKYTQICLTFMNKANFGFEISQCESYLKMQGFVDIKMKRYFVPIGTWPEDKRMKRVGELAIPVICTGVDSFDAAPKSVLKDSTLEQRKQFYEDVKRDILNPLYRIGFYQSSPFAIDADDGYADGS